jgi:hypothetical protein
MKICLTYVFLYVFIVDVISQNVDINVIKDSLKYTSIDNNELVIQNYDFSDTINNEFANYYIKNCLGRYMIRLQEFNEPSLTYKSKNEQYLFRILSLPSFYHPVCFTIGNKNSQYILHWTIGKGAGGYEPKGVMKKGKIHMLISDWEYFVQLTNLELIDNLPIASYLPMTDGTSWAIEKSIDNKQKIYFSNILPHGIEDGYALLLHLSGVKNEEVTYFDGSSIIRIFDKSNYLIDLLPIKEKIVARLNQSFHDSINVKEYCLDCGFYIKISSRGKIKSLKYTPYMLPFQSIQDKLEYFEDNFSDRKYRHKVKQSLENLEFKDLNLSKKIWIPVYIKYNKERQLLEVEDN